MTNATATATATVPATPINGAPVMKLFLIVGDSESGDSLNLFVRAETKGAALNLWKKFFCMEDEDYDAANGCKNIFEVPNGEGKPGAIRWSDIKAS